MFGSEEELILYEKLQKQLNFQNCGMHNSFHLFLENLRQIQIKFGKNIRILDIRITCTLLATS